jgi:ribulose-5-phosphate 4-epimerase/fuculose-1-phosphate aldolase
MKRLLDKFVKKILDQGLAAENNIMFLGRDADIVSNRPLDDDFSELIGVFDVMNINSLLYVVPAEPYNTIIRCLAENKKGRLKPADCETKTFLHDIPLINNINSHEILDALSQRKAAIVGNNGIVSYGSVSPEQAFISFSSVCFSLFVKFFSDFMFYAENCKKNGIKIDYALAQKYREVISKIPEGFSKESHINSFPPAKEEDVYERILEAGKDLVENSLVDSYFGNISYVYGHNIYISQTGSSMDELENCIDAVPLDGSSSSGITASSELSAHTGIFKKTGKKAIIHGHPKFTVVMSMSCRTAECDLSACYVCRRVRHLDGIPVVSGEIGTGPSGIAKTVPEAMILKNAVILYGHGIFAAGEDNFKTPFELVRKTEKNCREEYFSKINKLLYGIPSLI